MKHCGKKLLGLLFAAALCLAVGGSAALAEEPEVVTQPGANEPEFQSLEEWTAYYDAKYPVETYAEPTAVQSGDNTTYSVERFYSYTIPSSISVGQDGTGKIEITGNLYAYCLMDVSIESKNSFVLKNGNDGFDYTLGSESNTLKKADNKYKLDYETTESQLSITEPITVTLTDRSHEPLYSGNYSDTLTFTMDCQKKTYTITYDGNGGTTKGEDGNEVTSTKKTYQCGQYLTLPSCPFTKENGTFIGWATEQNGTTVYSAGTPITKVWTTVPENNAQLTLYAQWKKDTGRSITFNYFYQKEDGTYPDESTESYTDTLESDVDVKWTRPRDKDDDDALKIWDDATTTVGKDVRDNSTVRLEVPRKIYYLDINGALVDENGNLEGTIRGSLTDNGADMGKVTVAAVGGGTTESVHDYWRTAIHGSGYTVTIDENFLGKNTDIKGEYKYVYKGMIKQGNDDFAKAVASKIKETSPQKYLTSKIEANIRYPDANGYYQYKDSIVVIFQKEYIRYTYTVRLHSNTGDNSEETNDIPVTTGENVTLSSCPFHKDGYTFAGWSTSIDGKVEYGDSATIDAWKEKPAGTVIDLYAQWRANELIINYHSGTVGAVRWEYRADSSSENSNVTIPSDKDIVVQTEKVAYDEGYRADRPADENGNPDSHYGLLIPTRLKWNDDKSHVTGWKLGKNGEKIESKPNGDDSFVNIAEDKTRTPWTGEQMAGHFKTTLKNGDVTVDLYPITGPKTEADGSSESDTAADDTTTLLPSKADEKPIVTEGPDEDGGDEPDDVIVPGEPTSIILNPNMEGEEPVTEESGTLPECGFEAPAGMQFVGWTTQAQEAIADPDFNADEPGAGLGCTVYAVGTPVSEVQWPTDADGAESHELYALWRENILTIAYYPYGGAAHWMPTPYGVGKYSAGGWKDYAKAVLREDEPVETERVTYRGHYNVADHEADEPGLLSTQRFRWLNADGDPVSETGVTWCVNDPSGARRVTQTQTDDTDTLLDLDGCTGAELARYLGGGAEDIAEALAKGDTEVKLYPLVETIYDIAVLPLEPDDMGLLPVETEPEPADGDQPAADEPGEDPTDPAETPDADSTTPDADADETPTDPDKADPADAPTKAADPDKAAPAAVPAKAADPDKAGSAAVPTKAVDPDKADSAADAAETPAASGKPGAADEAGSGSGKSAAPAADDPWNATDEVGNLTAYYPTSSLMLDADFGAAMDDGT